MDPKDVTRKLRAILSADVQGYSRLMGDDEIATVETITEYRETITSLVTQWKGRVVDSPGDNILAEFGSVVDAVQCAVEIQHILKAKNEELPENRRMIFRIGVNLGDVIQEGDRIYGDGVNIAARIESLADGGGICISGTAYDQIKNKLALGYNYFGEHSVKNISEPVRVYKVPMEPGERKEKKRRIKRWQWVAAAVLVLILAGAAFWNFYLRSSLPSIEPASVEKMAFPLPDKPSIAVLPFTNMSGDPKQEYLADGISENVISALSHVPELFVIARQSTFTYKGKPVKIQQVAEELGVRYVLEGSVQRSGDTLRITAQLIDAITGHHLWSDRYDRKLKNIFALQDEITLNILQALEVKLTANEQYITFRKGTDNLEAYLKMLEAREYSGRSNKEGYAMAGKLAEEAITLDPDYPGPYLMLSAAHLMEISFGTSKLPKQSLKMAEKLVLKALALDDHLAEGYAFLGRIYLTKRQYDKALTAGEKACELAPNSSFVHAALGYSLHNAGRPEEAITHLKKAIRLSPFPRAWYLGTLGGAYYMLGRYEEAIAEFKKGLQLAPKSVFPRLGLAAAYSELGREEHARVEAAEVLSLDPKFTLVSHAKGRLSKNKDYTERYMAALRKAGLPDKPPLPLPDKPSIAVLPFANISGDPKEDYLSDGITEQIITALSKTPKLFVIARNSVFTYKGKPVMVQQVSDELGVRYVLEGSVQKSGDRIRITAQLIDAKTGNHLWAEKFDRD
ncbi:MAG: tetratricopeptide repeat protein, partial [Deltaproteobacteria bacterium]|nr:tetratricopeptide repeat protein [Deltaproteobacteria bacterium]